MARSHKFSIDFEELEGVLDDLKRAGGDIRSATEEALEESHAYITPLIEKKLDKSNLPKGGKFSSEDRKHSLKQVIKEPNIIWTGKDTCSVDVGFNLDETLVPIFLIRGTETMSPVKGLKNLLEGKGTQDKVAEIQLDVISKHIDDIFNF